MSAVMSVPLDATAEGAAEAAMDGSADAAAADGAATDGAVVAADEQAARASAATAPNAANRDRDRSVRNLLLQRYREMAPRPLGSGRSAIAATSRRGMGGPPGGPHHETHLIGAGAVRLSPRRWQFVNPR
jgi:hypothetical protein